MPIEPHSTRRAKSWVAAARDSVPEESCRWIVHRVIPHTCEFLLLDIQVQRSSRWTLPPRVRCRAGECSSRSCGQQRSLATKMSS
jgi:hypothetical protein